MKRSTKRSKKRTRFFRWNAVHARFFAMCAAAFFLFSSRDCSSLYAQLPTKPTPKTVGSPQTLIAHRLVVKFAAGSALEGSWKNAHRTGAIPAFSALLGTHTTRPFVDDGLLAGVENFYSLRTETRGEELTSSLERICTIELSAAKTDAELRWLAGKLARVQGVEYAEPVGTQRIAAEPNDPLIKQQWHLQTVHAFEAWDELFKFKRDSTPVVVAIVDTGIDFRHEDLSGVAHTNAGETGTDVQGRDKRSNGVDDDRNGKVDDWRGWDFIGAGDRTEDNDPSPGSDHGTHVAGLVGASINNRIGVAGTAPFVRLLPVKIGTDRPSPNVDNGFQAILYAASAGARVINCSWSVPVASRAELELTRAALAMGSIIVAAASNDAEYSPAYPASYPGVVSVAATTSSDELWSLSNYHESVAISAPGSSVYSTVLSNGYGFKSGTSMATPIVAGIAAMAVMRFPTFSSAQIVAQIKATSNNVDSLNREFIGRMGAGRVNALKALQTTTARWIELASYSTTTSDGDTIAFGGERAELRLRFRNLLASVNGVRVDFTVNVPNAANAGVQASTRSMQIGSFASLESREAASTLTLTIPQTIAANTLVTIQMDFFDGDGIAIGRNTIQFTVNPSFRMIEGNNIAVTLNSVGNFAFNDYPTNKQGEGFTYKGSNNLLYEGALLVASGESSISSVAQGTNRTQDVSFQARERIAVRMENPTPPQTAQRLTAQAVFADNNASADAGVSVRQTVTQSAAPALADVVTTSYDITNTSNRDFTALYVGLFCDWDIGNDVERNEIVWDDAAQLGIAQSKSASAPAPIVGMKLLSSQRVNFYAIDIADTARGNITLQDGFSRAEKWKALSGGIARARSSITDASVVMAAGPISLKRGETTTVAFALMAAQSLDSLYTISKTLQNHTSSGGLVAYPLPANGSVTVDFETNSSEQSATIELVNVLGQVALSRVVAVSAGQNQTMLNIASLTQGLYALRVRSQSGTRTASVLISR